MNKQVNNFFDEVKRLQPFQNEALALAIKNCDINEDEEISSEKLKELICEVEKILMTK